VVIIKKINSEFDPINFEQIKGVFVYIDSLCHQGPGTLSGSHARLRKQSELMARSNDTALTAQQVLRDLEAMLKEQDEPGFLHRPTEYAYDTARQIIENSYSHYIGTSPTPAIASDGEGGIIAEWKSGHRIVRLIVSASQDGKSYVYSRGNDQSAIDHSASGSILAQRLLSIFPN
jgi:hypothetical protein